MNQQQSPENVGMLYLAIIVIAAIFSLWWLGREWVIIPLIWLRLQECTLAFWVVTGLDKITGLWGWHLQHIAVSIHGYSQLLVPYLNVATAKKMSFEEFSGINNDVGSYVRYVVITILLFAAYLVYSRSETAKYRITHTMKSLRESEVVNWPQIQPILDLDLVKTDLNKGPWAMAQSPLGFCKKHKLIHKIDKDGYPVWGLYRDPATRLLTMQVGKQITDIDRLPIHTKALLVIFIARAVRKRKISDHFI